jgi:hypothetical protein
MLVVDHTPLLSQSAWVTSTFFMAWSKWTLLLAKFPTDLCTAPNVCEGLG